MVPTRTRGIRVPDELWQQVTEQAERFGVTASDVARAVLHQWVRLTQVDERAAWQVVAELDPALRKALELNVQRPGLRPADSPQD
jgi:negative regulator of replication initiation